MTAPPTEPLGPRGGWTFRVPEAAGPVRPAPPPSFTVVIPAYQAAGFVADAVRSVLAQTKPPVEVLVVDDGSTDDTAETLRPFDGAVRLLRIPHGGPSAARNAGLHAATGDFVAFLDADDVYQPEFLAALGALAAIRPDVDVLTADATFVVDGAARGTFMQANAFPTADQRGAVLERCFLTMMSAVRRSRLLEVGGFDRRLTHGEDWRLWIELVLGGSLVGLVDAPLGCYRAHSAQLTARRGRSLRGRHEVLAEVVHHDGLTAAERRAVGSRLSSLLVRGATVEAAEARGREARRRWLHVARLSVAPPRTRLGALVAALGPAPVARRAATRVGRG
jgi:Glycosyl transferase family 2